VAGSNSRLEELRAQLAKIKSGQARGTLMNTSMIEGMIKALEKAEADIAKKATLTPALPVVEKKVEAKKEVERTRSPIRLCLFDLDDTLLRTSDLDAFRGVANLNNASRQYTTSLLAAYRGQPDRVIYTREHHAGLRQDHHEMQWGIFTRAPRHYAQTLLDEAYPGLHWDTVIAFEDVRNTKPHGDGIWAAMDACEIENVDHVALVGDEKIDIQAAYQGGCWSILDQTSWERPWESPRYWAIERVPDAVIDEPAKLSRVLAQPKGYWPELEYEIDKQAVLPGREHRFDSINHFFPRPDKSYAPITVLGRLFGEYEELRPRRRWHSLTDQILAHKDATAFPSGWVSALRNYLYRLGVMGDLLATVIPFKPGRPARLEALLGQVKQSHLAEPIRTGRTFSFAPGLLAFREGAVSSHGHHLTREERFANVGENLYVAQPDLAKGKRIVIIDDVATTGATLLWAHRYLLAAGARSVNCVSLTKAVSIG